MTVDRTTCCLSNARRPIAEHSPNDRPLVSFCLFAYHQAEFIREAVAAALAQSYEPLEIVLSDDCSSDGTFQIMQEMAAGYHGPHRVILNRNETNLGLGAHINLVAALAQGEWLVFAAGDDISLPARVGRLMEAARQWSDAKAVLSAWDVIDEHGVKKQAGQNALPAGRFLGREQDMVDLCLRVRGAVGAWRSELFAVFSPLQPNVWREDVVLAFRALLCGAIVVVPDTLVQYRSHGGSISAGVAVGNHGVYALIRQREVRQADWARMLLSALCQMKRDYELFVARSSVGAVVRRNNWDKELDARIRISKYQGEWWQLRWRQKMEYIFHDGEGPRPSRKMRQWMLVRSGGMVSFVAFSLVKQCIHRLARKGVC